MGWSATKFTNPEGWQRVAGGRRAAKTPGRRLVVSGTLEGCQRCATLCPTQALVVREHPREYRGNAYWTARTIEEIYKQAETGGLLLSSMGSDMPHTLYWDNLLLDASQVTNPSIDPLREPMELKTFLGRKPRAVKLSRHGRTAVLETALAPQLEIETPILFSAMSYERSLHQRVCRPFSIERICSESSQHDRYRDL